MDHIVNFTMNPAAVVDWYAKMVAFAKLTISQQQVEIKQRSSANVFAPQVSSSSSGEPLHPHLLQSELISSHFVRLQNSLETTVNTVD